MSNFHLFEKLVFEMIRQVMCQFPDNVALDLRAIAEKVDDGKGEINYRMAVNTFEWLRVNGYFVQKSKQLGPRQFMISPTDKLFIIMSTIPEPLKAKNQTIWDFFVENSKAGLASTIQQGVNMIFTTGAKLFSLPWS